MPTLADEVESKIAYLQKQLAAPLSAAKRAKLTRELNRETLWLHRWQSRNGVRSPTDRQT